MNFIRMILCGMARTVLVYTSTCCSFNNPPYFTKQLPNPTTDDLEVRQCQTYRRYAGTLIEFMELYVK